MFLVKEPMFKALSMALVIMSPYSFAQSLTEYPMGKLAAIKSPPKVGDLYRIDKVAYSGRPVVLYCESSSFRNVNGCAIDATVKGMYLELGNDNFTNKDVSGRLMEFVKIKNGHLFFKLIDEK